MTSAAVASDPFPSRHERLRYVCGGRLERHREWVRHDLTDAGWRWRGVRRMLLQLLPFALLALLLPGPAYIRWMLPLFLLLAGTFVAAAYAEPIRDRRLRQHDLPVPGEAPPGT